MWYTTKKAILEHLGKNGRDVKQLDRLIEKGVVLHKDGRYAYRCDLELSRLREYKRREKEKSDSNPEIVQLRKELEEARANIEYYRDRYDELLEDRKNRLEK